MEQTLRMVPASSTDLDLLLELMAEYYACDGLRFDGRVASDGLGALLNDPAAGRAWLIHGDDRVCGYLFLTFCFSVEFGGRFGLIDEVYLRPEHRMRGLGRQAIAFAGEVARQMGCRAVRLEVEHENRGAQRLYQAIGFSAHERYLMTRWLAMPEGDSAGRIMTQGGDHGAKKTADR